MAPTAKEQTTGGLSVRLELAIVIIFTLLMTVPFIFRPFHMDDAGFLELSRLRQDEPARITIEDYTFFGQENEVFLDTHPPLISSYLAILMAVAGTESETVMHLGFLVFPLIAAVSMYFLARRYTRHAMLAALLLMATPGMMVMSHGLMSDVPGVSLWLAAVVMYLYGLERKSLAMMAAVGIVLTAGVLTSYQVLSAIPLLLAYLYVRREFSLLAVIPFALPLSVFFSYAGWHLAAVDSLPRFSYGVGEPMAWYSIIQKGAGAMLALAGAVIFFAIVMRVLLVRRSDLIVLVAFMAPLWVSILSQYLRGRYSSAAALLIIFLMPLGLLWLYRLFSDGWTQLRHNWGGERARVADDLLLLLWVAGVLFYVVVLLPYSSVRYLLPLFAPLILLFIRLTERRFAGSRETVRNILVAGVIGTAAMGLLVACADYELASAFRRFAYNEAADIGRRTAAEGGEVWFVGEFGFRYYMEQQGFRELPEDTEVPAGDVVIQSPLADPRPFSDELKEKVKLTDTIGYSAALPLRVTSFQDQAGFYGHFWGLLPFSLSGGQLEEFLVYQVVPQIEDTGEIYLDGILDREPAESDDAGD